MPEQRGTARGLTFSLELDLVEEVAHDAKRIDALITVRASGAGRPASADTFAEIIVMDRSLSMASHGKLKAAQLAACAAIDALDDGVYLGIVAGNDKSKVIFPGDGSLARVDSRVRARARERVRGLIPDGRTAIGTWLLQAADLFAAGAPNNAVCHAALYTDGRNVSETPEQLRRALARCADRFVCDPRGLGDDWDYETLLMIAEALHGDAKAVVEVADLTSDFVQLTENARRLVVPRVYLGLGPDSRFRVSSLRQVLPTEADLTNQQQAVDRDVHIPLGAWGAGTRQYQLTLTFDADSLSVGEEIRAARVALLAETPEGEREPCAAGVPLVLRRSELGAPPPPPIEDLTRVANNYELGTAMRACADAYLKDDFASADAYLRRALEFAKILRDTHRLRLLQGVAEDMDGVIRVRRGLKRGVIQELGVESTRTGVMLPEDLDLDVRGKAPVPDVVRVCRHCGEETYGQDATACEECGAALGGDAA